MIVAFVPFPSLILVFGLGAGAIFTVVGSDLATANAAVAAAVVVVATFAACVAAETLVAAI